jgi:putative transposase
MGSGYLEAGSKVRIDRDEYVVRRRIDETWQFENPRNGRLKHLEHTQLLTMIAEGRLRLVSHGAVREIIKSRPELLPEDEITAKRRRAYAEAVKDLPNSPGACQSVILDAWKRIKWPEIPPSFITVYRWKARYLKAGRDMRVLADRSHAKGRRGPRYPLEVVRICERAIDTRYMQRFGNSIQDTLEHAQYLVIQENKLRVEGDELPLPSRRMLTRMIARIPSFDKHAARKGYVSARNHFRNVKGHITAGRPLERCEIDHTRLDLIVLEDDTGREAGKPNITACIDVHTRMVLGIDISFEDPSYYTVQKCLRHCIVPKVNLDERYPGVVNEWPSYGLIDNLVCDNGLEFHGTGLEKAGDALTIVIMNAPRKTPQAKGVIERFLGMLNAAIAHQAPGTTFSNIAKKGDYNSQKEARVRFSVVERAIIKWIVDVYHQKPHPALDGMSPMEKWMESARTEEIRMPDDSVNLGVVLGRADTRTLTHGGVQFKGLHYTSPELKKLRRLHGAKLDVEIRINDDDLGSIWILSPNLDEPVQAFAIETEYAPGLTLRQHEVHLARRAEKLKGKHGAESLIEAKEEVRSILREVESEGPSKLGRNFAAYKGRSRSQGASEGTRRREASVTLSDEQSVPIRATEGGNQALQGVTPDDRPIQLSTERPTRRFKPILKRGYDIE